MSNTIYAVENDESTTQLSGSCVPATIEEISQHLRLHLSKFSSPFSEKSSNSIYVYQCIKRNRSIRSKIERSNVISTVYFEWLTLCLFSSQFVIDAAFFRWPLLLF
ncbi:hypothetical protein EDC96DRAFT_548570 [Choanephora cucurbitarum]|nr:hypothetical protein EDC96DRAFT_548570 [Choanephora cucurbitarum]